MGVGPLMGWRHTSAAALAKQFLWPTTFGVIIGIVAWFFGRNVFAALGLAVCAFAAGTIVQEYVRGILARRSTTGENVFAAMGNLWRRNGRRYGGYIVHLGIVMLGVAIVGNEFYQQTTNVTLARGDTVQIGGYELEYTGIQVEQQPNREEYGARVVVYDVSSGRELSSVTPKRNIYYKTPDMPTSEVGLRMTPIQDVYVVLNGWEAGGSTATFTIYVNPLTMWMWVGGLVIVFGTLICAWPHPARRQAATVSSVAYATGD
jgi:cytochrome c-type biogenesis protein CcmF